MAEVSITAIQDKIRKSSHLFKGLSPEDQNKKLMEILSPEELDFLQQQQQTQQCIFCKIAKGEVPTTKIYEDENLMAFFDINPANVGHAVVITKEHISVLPQVPDELDGVLLKLIKVLSSAVFDATGAKGLNILQNNGSIAGQVLPHVYFHIIPRFENDELSFTWKPKKIEDEKTKEVQTKIVELAKNITLKAQKKIYDISGKELSKEEVKQVDEKQKDEVKMPVDVTRRIVKKRIP